MKRGKCFIHFSEKFHFLWDGVQGIWVDFYWKNMYLCIIWKDFRFVFVKHSKWLSFYDWKRFCFACLIHNKIYTKNRNTKYFWRILCFFVYSVSLLDSFFCQRILRITEPIAGKNYSSQLNEKYWHRKELSYVLKIGSTQKTMYSWKLTN